jgi:hypothetical protein
VSILERRIPVNWNKGDLEMFDEKISEDTFNLWKMCLFWDIEFWEECVEYPFCFCFDFWIIWYFAIGKLQLNNKQTKVNSFNSFALNWSVIKSIWNLLEISREYLSFESFRLLEWYNVALIRRVQISFVTFRSDLLSLPILRTVVVSTKVWESVHLMFSSVCLICV